MHTGNNTKIPSQGSAEDYPRWRSQLLQDLVPTHMGPDTDIAWTQFACIPGRMGAARPYCERWYSAQLDGRTIYKCPDLGIEIYAPLATVQEWLAAEFRRMAERLGAPQAARNMLDLMSIYNEHPELFSEYLRPYEANLSEYLELARQSEWLIGGAERDDEYRTGCIRAAERYDIPYVVLRHLAWGDDRSVTKYLPSGHDIRALYIHPGSGHIYVELMNRRWYDGDEMLARIKDAREGLTGEPEVDQGDTRGDTRWDAQ